MYRTVLQNGKTAGWYFNELPDAGTPEEDYTSVFLSSEEADMTGSLLRRGYSFIERSIVMEIPLDKFRSAVRPGKRSRIEVVEDWQPEAVFGIAKETFETDCRFGFDPARKDTGLKNELLCGFITELRREGDTIATYLCQEERLEGFNIWHIRRGAGQVLLGAVSDRYRNSGIALPLYSRTAEAMKERGAGTLRDVVASSNLSSLNLHAMLVRCAGGAFRFGYCQDCYRKEATAAAVSEKLIRIER